MGLHDVIAADAKLIADGGDGESIGYTPSGGSEQTINAIVNRGPLEVLTAVDGMVAWTVKIAVAVSDVATVTINADTVSLPERYGGTAVDWRVAEIINQTAGWWELGLARV